jgi:two-component system LytT family response regulator
MSKIVIIDDEFLARSMVREYLQKYPQLQIVAECSDGFEGLKAIQEHQPDLIFLDIQMPKINGFEMLELVDDPPAVIFATAFDEYAIKAFDAHAIDYLLKPFDQERFDKAISKFLLQHKPEVNATKDLLNDLPLSNVNNRIVVKVGNKIKIIPVQEVLYLEASDDFVKIFTKEGYFLKNKTMSFFETFLPRDLFVRCHRSFIVSISEITRIDPYEKDGHLAILKNGARINVSRQGYGKLREVLGL